MSRRCLPRPDLAHGCSCGDRLAGFAGLADPGADLALGERLLVGAGGVTAVGPQFLRPDPRLGERIEERQQGSAARSRSPARGGSPPA